MNNYNYTGNFNNLLISNSDSCLMMLATCWAQQGKIGETISVIFLVMFKYHFNYFVIICNIFIHLMM